MTNPYQLIRGFIIGAGLLLLLPGNGFAARNITVGQNGYTSLDYFSRVFETRGTNGACYRDPLGKLSVFVVPRGTTSLQNGDRGRLIRYPDKRWKRAQLLKARRLQANGRRLRRTQKRRFINGVAKIFKSCLRLKRDGRYSVNIWNYGSYESQIIFKDAFKQSLAWIQSDLNQDTSSIGDTLPIGEDGWPTVNIPWTSPNGGAPQKLSTISYLTIPNMYPAGQYTLILSGANFTLRLSGATQFREFTQAGTYTVNVDNSSDLGIVMELARYNTSSPLRIKLLIPGTTDDDRHPFNPRFLADWSGVHMLRLMPVMGTIEGLFPCSNGVDATDSRCIKVPADMPTRSYRTQTQFKGVSLSYLIDLCEDLHVGACWFNVQHGATDDFIRAMARQLRRELHRDIKIYLEYSNEIFNSEFANGEYQYPQHIFMGNLGLANGLDNNVVAARRKQIAVSSARVFRIFKQVFGKRQARRRLRFVMGGHAGDPSFTDDVMRYFNNPTYNPSRVKAHFLATAAYIGYSTLNHFSANGQANTADASDILDHLEAGINNDLPDPWEPTERVESLRELVRNFKAIADSHSIAVTSYEAGQHCVPQAPMPEADRDALRVTAIAANDHPRIKDVFRQLDLMWQQETGGALFNLFANTQSAQAVYDQDPFGLQKYTGQPRAAAPKYEFLMERLEASGHRYPQ